MKIVIDIPERVVTAIQNGEDYRYDIHTAIAQGIPYEPKGDLISREALKEAFEDLFYNDYDDQVRTERLIDNAPTISLQDIYQEGHYDGHLEGYTKAINEERPQGEWIEKEETPASVSYYCSICKMEGIPITPFCPWCGAKMKGGAV